MTGLENREKLAKEAQGLLPDLATTLNALAFLTAEAI